MAPFVDLSTKGAITRRASIEFALERGWKVMAGWGAILSTQHTVRGAESVRFALAERRSPKPNPTKKEREITGRAA